MPNIQQSNVTLCLVIVFIIRINTYYLLVTYHSTWIDKYLTNRKVSDSSKASDADFSKHSRMEIILSYLPSDPGTRTMILDYDPNVPDKVRRAYLLEGPFQPKCGKFPYILFGKNHEDSMLHGLMLMNILHG